MTWKPFFKNNLQSTYREKQTKLSTTFDRMKMEFVILNNVQSTDGEKKYFKPRETQFL